MNIFVDMSTLYSMTKCVIYIVCITNSRNGSVITKNSWTPSTMVGFIKSIYNTKKNNMWTYKITCELPIKNTISSNTKNKHKKAYELTISKLWTNNPNNNMGTYNTKNQHVSLQYKKV